MHSLHETQEMCKKSCIGTFLNIFSKEPNPVKMKDGINDHNNRDCDDNEYESLYYHCFYRSEIFINGN